MVAGVAAYGGTGRRAVPPTVEQLHDPEELVGPGLQGDGQNTSRCLIVRQRLGLVEGQGALELRLHLPGLLQPKRHHRDQLVDLGRSGVLGLDGLPQRDQRAGLLLQEDGEPGQRIAALGQRRVVLGGLVAIAHPQAGEQRLVLVERGRIGGIDPHDGNVR